MEKKELETICEFYDFELDKLEKVYDLFSKKDLNFLNEKYLFLNNEGIEALKKEETRIFKLYKNNFNPPIPDCYSVERFLFNPNTEFKVCIDSACRTSMAKNFFLETKFTSYYISRFISSNNCLGIVKLNLFEYSKTKYAVQEEMLLIEESKLKDYCFTIFQNVEYENLLPNDKRKLFEKVFETYKDANMEYYCFEKRLVRSLEALKLELSSKFKINVDFKEIEETKYTDWCYEGYKAYDNRSKGKTLKKQFKRQNRWMI